MNPIVISYENKFAEQENSQYFHNSLHRYGWEIKMVGDGEPWNGFISKLNGYRKALNELPPEQIVVLSDSRDVFCVRSPLHFIPLIQPYVDSGRFVISAEMFLNGHLDWNEEQLKSGDFWQGVPLTAYWTYHQIEPIPLRKYVNSGLIAGKVSHISDALEWILSNGFTDDQHGFAHYINAFPERVYLDTNATLLHTSDFGVDSGLYDMQKQCMDSPTFAELLGHGAFFLHIPGHAISKGQKKMYEMVKKVLKSQIPNGHTMYELYHLTPKPNPYHMYFEKYIR